MRGPISENGKMNIGGEIWTSHFAAMVMTAAATASALASI